MKEKRKKNLIYILIFANILAPLLLISILNYQYTKREFDQAIFTRRLTYASLAAATLKERLDHLMDVTTSYSTRLAFRELIREKQWELSLKKVENIRSIFPFIERIFLTDLNGIPKVASPSSPNLENWNFSQEDWFQKVSSTWVPYLSHLYSEQTLSGLQVLSIAIPLNSEGDVKQKLGILVFQIRAEAFLEWVREVNAGSDLSLVFVDSQKNMVGPTSFDVHNFSKTFSQDLLSEQGVGVFDSLADGQKHLISYKLIQPYSWGALISQPLKDAHRIRNKELKSLIYFYSFIFLLSCALTLFILRQLHKREQHNLIQKQNSEKLRQVNRELEAFAYSVSHDLRAPVRAIAGFSDILIEDYSKVLDTEGQRLLKVVAESAKRLGQLIEDLLNFSRLASKELNKTEIDMQALVSSLSEELKSLENSREILVKISDLPKIQGDLSLIRQVWVNLISNALKFTRHQFQAQIEIDAYEKEHELIFRIKDNGVGFNMRYQEKLFSVFQRLHHKDEFEGTGVGLAIVQRVIGRHEGKIWAESQLGAGATFYFSLPKVKKITK